MSPILQPGSRLTYPQFFIAPSILTVCGGIYTDMLEYLPLHAIRYGRQIHYQCAPYPASNSEDGKPRFYDAKDLLAMALVYDAASLKSKTEQGRSLNAKWALDVPVRHYLKTLTMEDHDRPSYIELAVQLQDALAAANLRQFLADMMVCVRDKKVVTIEMYRGKDDYEKEMNDDKYGKGREEFVKESGEQFESVVDQAVGEKGGVRYKEWATVCNS